ncbi:MAG: RagB/SusD family nutrient uptake outer membrane protein [Saprospiraceae bacterium]
MKKTYKFSISFLMLFVVFTLSSCLKDLNQEPTIEVTSAAVYKDPSNYIKVLAKLYSGLATSGQQGPSGKADLAGLDEGFSQYARLYWKLQELPTDEAVCGWRDGTLPDFHTMTWTPSNEFIRTFFARVYYQITLCNEFIRETTDEKLKDRGVVAALANDIKAFRAEARFLRALSYYHAMDFYGNVPFVTEADAPGSFFPIQKDRAFIYNYVESELKAIDGDLNAPRAVYGRADKACAWALLAKLYLNSEVYIAQKKYTEAITYSKKVIDAGYILNAKYETLFMADNNTSKEIIFSIQSDGLNTRTWGGTTFMVNAPIGGSMSSAEFGVKGGWGGLRTTSAFVTKFDEIDINRKGDLRANFHTDGQNREIEDMFTFKDGYAIKKFKNVTSTGKVGSDPTGTHPDTDFPLLRLADFYLVYAEAVLRGGSGGDRATALNYVNLLKTRSSATTIADKDLNLDFILDERARELYWEAQRRTDLIRFNKFTTGTYLWPWKGNAKEGKAVGDHMNLYPIPADDLASNKNLKQNDGYN